MRVVLHLIPLLFLFPAFFPSLSQTTCSAQHTTTTAANDDDSSVVYQLHQFKLRIADLESVLAESVRNLNERVDQIQQREKRIDDMSQKIHRLQSVLSSLKEDSLLADERLNALEQEVRRLWAVLRKNNFDIHVLESKAQDAEDRLESVTSQAEKMNDMVTEQWIQLQRLQQALHIQQARTLRVQRQVSYTRCTFLKFFNNLLDDHLLKVLVSNLRSVFSRTLHQLNRIFVAFKRSHHQLQHSIKETLEKNGFTAALANEELIFYLATALIILPIMLAWMFLSSKFQATCSLDVTYMQSQTYTSNTE
ncbi:hypothetical protein ACLB2K_023874 [Fragaria x ananassa]